MKCERYDIGFVNGDLVTDVWNDGVGLVIDILWENPTYYHDECLPPLVTVLWARTGEEGGWDPHALKKLLDFPETL